ncbi:MAG: hypothetical protein L6Q37_09390, partial [Bdellovibrionaceae bacterium]|nr:hypothetical protein [Pseudobdellovibrionaceae bacterium]
MKKDTGSLLKNSFALKNPPKWLERLAIFFPFFHGIVISYQGFVFLKNPRLMEFFLLMACIYIFPLILSRLLKLFFSLKRGVCRIGYLEQEGNFWIILHRLQFLFITFDFFEKVLILIPGF